jgi:hypothetical protein
MKAREAEGIIILASISRRTNGCGHGTRDPYSSKRNYRVLRNDKDRAFRVNRRSVPNLCRRYSRQWCSFSARVLGYGQRRSPLSLIMVIGQLFDIAERLERLVASPGAGNAFISPVRHHFVADEGHKCRSRRNERRYGPETPVPEWHKQLVCSRCGSHDTDFVVTGERR